jgi:hypothetical protein
MKAELIYECTDLGTAQEVRICEEWVEFLAQ